MYIQICLAVLILKNAKSQQLFYHFISNLSRVCIRYTDQHHKSISDLSDHLTIYRDRCMCHSLYYKSHISDSCLLSSIGFADPHLQ